MSSVPGFSRNANAREDTEPLLGEAGDVTQRPYEGFQWNILTGTAAVAQGGIWVLTAIVWAAVFEHPLSFFSVHPLVNSAGVLFLVQAILLLQPTHTPKQKVQGAYIHSVFNLLALACFITGLVVIEINKNSNPSSRFQAIHGRLGLAVYILIFIQFLVGFLQFYTPQIFGSIDKAKSIYKYHRVSGYLILVLGLVTIILAVTTKNNKTNLHIQMWAVVTTSVITLVGIVPRIKLAKFGIKK